MSMLRKSVTLSLQEEIDTLKKNNSFAISLSNPSFSPKSLKNITLLKFNLQPLKDSHLLKYKTFMKLRQF